jgi:hypothetical protein
MGHKTRTSKRIRKGGKKKSSKRKSTKHEHVEIKVPEIVHTRLKERPLYEQWDALFKPGEKSFFDRWLCCTPPTDQTREFYAAVDTSLPISMGELNTLYRTAKQTIEDQRHERLEAAEYDISSTGMFPPIESASKIRDGAAPKDSKRGEQINKNSVQAMVSLEYSENLNSMKLRKREVIMCEECEIVDATLFCIQCEQHFCEPCLLQLHHSGKRLVNHFWEPLRREKAIDFDVPPQYTVKEFRALKMKETTVPLDWSKTLRQ